MTTTGAATSCDPTHREGGADYVHCHDCGVFWDYRKSPEHPILPPVSGKINQPLAGERDELLPKLEAFMKFPTWGVVIGAAMYFLGALIYWIVKGARIL